MTKENKILKSMNELKDTIQNKNYYKSKYMLCGDHTGFDNGHYFNSLINAKKYLALGLLLNQKNSIYELTHKKFTAIVNGKEIYSSYIDLHTKIN